MGWKHEREREEGRKEGGRGGETERGVVTDLNNLETGIKA